MTKTTKTIRYADVLRAESDLPPMVGRHPLSERINEILAAAEDNATTDAGRINSIIMLLCFEPRKEILEWFANLGITP
jgi:hypothetical protein